MQAASAGVAPDKFWDLTLYEIQIAIEGHTEREKISTIGRIMAIARSFSKGDPLEGLIEGVKRKAGLLGGMAAYTFWGRDTSDIDDDGN